MRWRARVAISHLLLSPKRNSLQEVSVAATEILNCGIIRQALIGIRTMKKIIIASVAALAVASFAGCMGKGKGKGKEPVAAPAPVYEETYVTKG